MAHADLVTRCTTCREELRIAREATQYARPITCRYCGGRFPLWQLVGRANRETVVEDYAPQFPRAPFAESPGWEAA